jgi:release factor glutamine methyltransferase
MSTIDRSEGPPWTVLGTLQWTAAFFERHQIENPRAAAEILLAHSLNCRRIDLYLRHDQPLHNDELARFRDLIRRRAAHEPVAYIVGQKEFWSLDFRVSPAVLIPRPETECLVEAALDYLPAHGNTATVDVLELGTGSGVIITALAHERPGNRYWATDRSIEAIMLAGINSRRHVGASTIRFAVGHWFELINPKSARFDMILSNPPYISQGDIAGLATEIHAHEPRMALDGGPDGLRDLRKLIFSAHEYLKPGGILILEIGYNQGEAVTQAGRSQSSYSRIEIKKDYGGQDRVALFAKAE